MSVAECCRGARECGDWQGRDSNWLKEGSELKEADWRSLR